MFFHTKYDFVFTDYGSCSRSRNSKEDAWLFLYGRRAMRGIIRTILLKRNEFSWVEMILHNDHVIISGNRLLQRVFPPFSFPFPDSTIAAWMLYSLSQSAQLVSIPFYTLDSLSSWSVAIAMTATMRKEKYLFVCIYINLPWGFQW